MARVYHGPPASGPGQTAPADIWLTNLACADFTRDRLAAYKRPRRVVFVSSLPATSTGKIMRRKLAEASQAEI